MAPPLLETAGHIHISEREADGSWEDCTWDSGLEWYRICYDSSRPATHAEAQALRKASGEPTTGGSNIGNLRDGIKARYNRDLPVSVSGFIRVWALLKPGVAGVVQGSMSAFGPTHRLSTYDRNFNGAHAVLVVRVYDEDRVWWCDPEAPLGSYDGQWVTKGELRQFVDAFNGNSIFAPVKLPAEADMTIRPITSIGAMLMDVPAGTPVLALDGATVLRPPTTALRTGVLSPYGVGTLRAWYVNSASGVLQVGLSKPANLRIVPDMTPYALTDLTAAKVAGKAEGVVEEKSRIAEAEKARILAL